MNRSWRKSIGVGVAAAVVIGACWWGVVRNNALSPFICFRLGSEQGDMIDMFEDDPLYSVSPNAANLVEETTRTYDCDNGHGGSPLNPSYASATRLYATPNDYSFEQLQQLFDEPAAKSGWRLAQQKRTSDQGFFYVYIRYCKQFPGRVADAWIQARPGPYDQRGERGGQVEVTMNARVDGTSCTRIVPDG